MNKAAVIRDVAGIAGAAMIAVGVGMIYVAAGVITGGVLLLGGVLLAARRG